MMLKKNNPQSKVSGASGRLTLECLESRRLLAAIDIQISTVLPLLTNDTTPSLAGTVGDNTADVQINLKQGDDVIGTWDAVEDGSGNWDFTLPDVDALSDGTYDILATAVANGGADSGEILSSSGLIVDTASPAVTIHPLATNVLSPGLTGTVNDPAASIGVTVNGAGYAAVNNGDGTWSLAAGQITDLAEGTYDVAVTATDLASNAGTDATADELVIDQTPPAVTVNALVTGNASPGLTGAVNDPAASISVRVNEADYAAVNNGDGTWSLAAGQIAVLAEGTYNVSVTATDAAGNAGTDATADELVIDLAPTVTIQPLITNIVSPELTGTVDDPGAAITVTVNGADYAGVNNGDGTWSLAAGQIADLAEGVYDITVTAEDAIHNLGTDSTTDELVIDLTAPEVTTASLITANSSPALSGTIDDPLATIEVSVDGGLYPAVNHGDGTWSLAAGTVTALPDGLYNITVMVSDSLGNVRSSSAAFLQIDSTGPALAVDDLLTADTTPALSGTIDDNTAGITVQINGSDYAAVNNADGTWTLPDNTAAALAEGVYEVTVVATDGLGNAGSASGTLSIAGTTSVTLGDGISTLHYLDADGTDITLSAGKGHVTVILTGANLTTSGSGKIQTISSDSGIMRVAVDIAEDTKSLSVKTRKGGDGLAVIDSVTGVGSLQSLKGSNLILGGEGINMTGSIQTLNVHALTADVVMGSAAKGAVISADIMQNCNVQAETIKALSIKNSFANSNILADTLGTVTLSNVAVDNGGVSFGITAGSLKKCTLKQCKTNLVWGKDFTDGILDLRILA